MPDFWGQAAIGAKFLLYLGILTSTGLIVCRIVFAAHLEALDRSIRALAIWCSLLGIVAAVVGFSLRGAVLMDDISGMIDPSMLSLLWDTPPGDALVLRCVGLGLVAICSILGGRALWGAFLGGALALWSFAEIGHIASQGRPWLQVILFAHLLAAAFWIGILTPLRSMARQESQMDAAAALGENFGRIASVVVPILVFAGLVMSWFLVGSLPVLFGSAYGLALVAKLAVVAGLLFLAAKNKTRFVPAMRRGESGSGDHLANSISLEWGCVAFILLATATFTSVLTVPT